MKYVDYYAALGVARDADLEQIKKAYRKLAHQHHPDVSKTAGSEEHFKNAAAAYATLKNPDKRAAYDLLGIQLDGAEMRTPPSGPAAYGFDANPVDFEGMDLDDLLNAIRRGHAFGTTQRSTERGPMRGPDMVDSADIDLLQASKGCILHLAFVEAGERRELEVTIPAGVRSGQKLRLRGKGGKGQRGGEPGDLYLHIGIKPHPVFRTDHQDLYFDLSLTPWEAALGAEVTVTTLEGPVLLTIPAGTSSGKKLRLRGRGLPESAGAHARRGDMYALVAIAVPATLTAQERTLLEELSRISTFTPRNQLNGTPHEHTAH